MAAMFRCGTGSKVLIENLLFRADNTGDSAVTRTYTFNVSGLKKIVAVTAQCSGYPGHAMQYAKLEKYEDGEWTTIINQAGAYVNDNSKSTITDIDISKATQLRATCLAKGSNSTAGTNATITLSLSN